ncbi:MAG: VIT domain-containing protein [Myxococcota bacterium]
MRAHPSRARPVLPALLFTLASTSTLASPAPDDVEAPYFQVTTPGAVDAFPLKDTRAEVRISGVVAHVHVTQTYRNDGKATLEAEYVFPASTRAAVHGMKMTVGARTITAAIRKRDDARREYARARDEGRAASLLDQERPNVLQMHVANIRPGDQVTVGLDYVEHLVPEEGVYEFAYPAVVGPRYAGGVASEERWVANPHVAAETPPFSWDLAVNLTAGVPIRELMSPSHTIGTNFVGPAEADVVLDATEHNPGNRDFILRYRLQGDDVTTGMLLHPGDTEGFFLLMAQPPQRVEPSMMPPREYVFIVDVSGSMSGFPLSVAKDLMRNLLGGMRGVDLFNVLLFSGGSSVLAEESVPASDENVARAMDLVDNQHGGGGTELLPALQRALKLPRDHSRSRMVVLITDGYVGVEARAFELIREHLDRTNVFAFGIGSSVNRHLIEGLARAGAGEPTVVTSGDDVKRAAERFQRMVSQPVLTDVEVRFEGMEVHDLEPARIPDLLAERPVVIMGKYRGAAQGRVILRGRNGGSVVERVLDVPTPPTDGRHSALRTLWARQRVAHLVDLYEVDASDARAKTVTALGLQYGLLTPFTSFVATDSERRNAGGSVTIRQPLPAAEGVTGGVAGLMGKSSGSAYGYGGLGTGSGGGGAARGGVMAVYGTLGRANVSGALDKGSVARVIRAADFRKCYDVALRKEPKLAGRVTLRLVISAEGKVTGATTESTDITDENMLACIRKRAARMTFPTGSGELKVSYPLVFRPANGG